jgi:hypothetical protein
MDLHNNCDVTKYLETAGLFGFPQAQAPSQARFLDCAKPQGIKITTTPAVAFLFLVDYLVQEGRTGRF